MKPDDLNLICTIDEDVPESIIGDPFRLRQVLTNLMNHSIKTQKRERYRLRCLLKNNKDGVITLGLNFWIPD